jgi:hypothetical protein
MRYSRPGREVSVVAVEMGEDGSLKARV